MSPCIYKIFTFYGSLLKSLHYNMKGEQNNTKQYPT